MQVCAGIAFLLTVSGIFLFIATSVLQRRQNNEENGQQELQEIKEKQ